MLHRDLLRKIRKIEIVTSRLVNDTLAGAYHSVFKGRGMVFSEVREYQAGDDVRQIDWNVSARMNEPFIKLFIEEREMTVMLVVDMSGSGRFGSRGQEKRELQAEIAAIAAFSAIKNNDRVGLIIFTDRIEKFVPPKKGKKHVLRVITEILSFEPESTRTDVGVALEYLGRIARRKSVAFLISDFDSPPYDKALRIANRKHDLVPVCIGDPMEDKLPPLGFVYFEDPETGEVIEFDTSGPGAESYRRRVAQQRAEREATWKKLDIDFINLRTGEPYVAALVQFFRVRERRLHH
jgi:uncharacterized protein (DUF58 family)